MKILIAEDDMASRKFISKFLSKFGEVEAAENGMEVVDLFAKRMKEGIRYDFICLDIMMPKVDGYKALTVIRDIERKNGISKEIISNCTGLPLETVDQLAKELSKTN